MATNSDEKVAWGAAMEESLLTNPLWKDWALQLRKFAHAVPQELVVEARDMKTAVFKALHGREEE
eukprot:1577812-Pyramimonas_sp.AAC.1